MVYRVLTIHCVHAVYQSLHLAAHLIIVDGGGPADDIGLEYLGHNVVHIVLDHASAQLLAAETTFAELDVLAYQRDLLYIVSGGLGAFCKPVGQHVAVGAGAQACGDYYYLFHNATFLPFLMNIPFDGMVTFWPLSE